MAVPAAERKRAAREAERRREAAALLRLMSSLCEYGAKQVADGLAPDEARAAVIEMAGEFTAAAVSLRRLARVPARERAALARSLAGLGYGTQEIATRLGVSAHSAWNYQHGRRGDGQPWAPS